MTNTQHGAAFGGEICWIMVFDTGSFGTQLDEISNVGTAWGGFPPGNAIPNGTPGHVYVWDDLDEDGDPRTGMVSLVVEGDITVANVDTNIVNYVALSDLAHVEGVFFVGISVSWPTTFFPAPGNAVMKDCGDRWLTGSPVPEGFDPVNLSSAGNFALTPIEASWLTRAIGASNPGSLFCPGDGSGNACPCGNESPTTVLGGCSNSGGLGGALTFTGTASATGDDLLFIGANLLPGQAALLFVGLEALAQGDGLPFGDGLRCVGTQVIRLGLRLPNNLGRAIWGPDLQQIGNWDAGDVRCFQVWYRDPLLGPCGSGFNLTNAAEIEFGV